MQGLVLFTTREVITGEDAGKPFHSYEYVKNQPSQTNGAEIAGDLMMTLLPKLLKQELKEIGGGRESVYIFW